jgi:multiple sugar transport system ATP-binding protein
LATVGIDGIRKRFGAVEVLKGISLAIEPGEFVTLVGPSGCGKSTLLRIIAGLERQDEGSIAIDGRVVDALRPRARDVAMVFQSYALYPYMTARENLELPLVMRRLNRWQRLPLAGRFAPGTRAARIQIDAEIAQVAGALEIGHLLDRKPAQLSGGQRQRVALGRAMVRRPLVFLMDEPLSNLDAKLRVQMRTEIAELHRRLGATFVYVTHDQSEAMTMSDRIAVMMDGEILQVASPEEIYADPADLRVAQFIGSPRINVAPAHVGLAGKVTLGDTPLPLTAALPVGSPLQLAFRPEAAELIAADPRLPMGRVILVEHLGSDLLVHMVLDQESAPVILRAPPRRRAVRVGDRLGIAVPAEQMLLFDAAGQRIGALAAGEARRRAHG